MTTLVPLPVAGTHGRPAADFVDCPGWPASSFAARPAAGRQRNPAPATTAMLLTCHSLSAIDWGALPTAGLPGPPGGVAVCRVAVAENQHHAPRLWELLTGAEQQRARRYHAAADYHRFVIGRAALRLLLGGCLGLPPTALHFAPGDNHKPILATAPELHYNVSHSGNWVLIAIAAVAVGVDVEKINAQFPFEEVLEHSFSEPERMFIGRHPAQPAAFYRLWTRKEAFVKATAQGIDADFTRVPALDGRHPWQATYPNTVADWTVSSFAAAPGYVAAVAYPAAIPAGQVRFYEVGEGLLSMGKE